MRVFRNPKSNNMKLIAVTISPTEVSYGTTTGQLKGYVAGTLQFATEGYLPGVRLADVEFVLGITMSNAERTGYTNQGGNLFEVTAEQIAALETKGRARIEAASAKEAAEDSVLFIETGGDINLLLRAHGNAAAAE